MGWISCLCGFLCHVSTPQTLAFRSSTIYFFPCSLLTILIPIPFKIKMGVSSAIPAPASQVFPPSCPGTARPWVTKPLPPTFLLLD